jgi:hypothetical protein
MVFIRQEEDKEMPRANKATVLEANDTTTQEGVNMANGTSKVNRTYEERIAEIDRVIAHHQERVEKLNADRQRLVDRQEGRFATKAGKPFSPESLALLEQVSTLSEEEFEQRRLAVQREAFILNRMRKQRSEAVPQA